MKKAVDGIQTFLAGQKKQFSEVAEKNSCSICLADFVAQDDIVQLRCSDRHIFHVDCLLGWLETLEKNKAEEKSCPLCREKIEVIPDSKV